MIEADTPFTIEGSLTVTGRATAPDRSVGEHGVIYEDTGIVSLNIEKSERDPKAPNGWRTKTVLSVPFEELPRSLQDYLLKEYESYIPEVLDEAR